MIVNLITDTAIKLFICGLVVHWVLDWIFQNDWMAKNKSNLKHPSAYVHSGIHLVGLLFIFPVWTAFLLALTHLLIDTRIPLAWWRKFYGQTEDGMIGLHVAIWSDQVLHIMVLAVTALIVGR